jgi:hypothetical protein
MPAAPGAGGGSAASAPGVSDGGGGGQGGGKGGGGGSGSTSTSPKIGVWQQCGGLGGCCSSYGACVDGPFPGQACGDGNVCQRVNEWHWQCSPSGGGVVLGAWDQCGGMGGSCASSFCVDGPFPRCCCRCLLLPLLGGLVVRALHCVDDDGSPAPRW